MCKICVSLIRFWASKEGKQKDEMEGEQKVSRVVSRQEIHSVNEAISNREKVENNIVLPKETEPPQDMNVQLITRNIQHPSIEIVDSTTKMQSLKTENVEGTNEKQYPQDDSADLNTKMQHSQDDENMAGDRRRKKSTKPAPELKPKPEGRGTSGEVGNFFIDTLGRIVNESCTQRSARTLHIECASSSCEKEF